MIMMIRKRVHCNNRTSNGKQIESIRRTYEIKSIAFEVGQDLQEATQLVQVVFLKQSSVGAVRTYNFLPGMRRTEFPPL